MRKLLLFIGGVLLGCFAYVMLSALTQQPITEFVNIVLLPVPILDYATPFRPFDLAFIGIIVLATSHLVKPKKTVKRGRPPKNQVKQKVGRRLPYRVEAIIVGDDVNHHEHVKTDKLKMEYKYGETEYEITPGKLYSVNQNMFKKIRDNLQGVKRRFCIVFEEGKSDALGPKGSEESETDTVSSGLLHVVERSTIFRRAFSELFAKQLGGKKILFIVILVVVGVVVYLVMSGQLDLRRLGFI